MIMTMILQHCKTRITVTGLVQPLRGRQQRSLTHLLRVSTTTTTTNPCLWQSQQQPQHQVTTLMLQQQFRWKHSAKMGKHLQNLDDMAHDSSRQAAAERRQKKKDKKQAKKHKKGSTTAQAEGKLDSKDRDDLLEEQDEEDDDEEEEQEQDDDHAQDVLPDPAAVKERMMNLVTKFTASLKAIRGAEPTPELFDEITVHAYGNSATPLKSVAQVVIASPTLASATCFDPAVAKHVAAALQQKLGLNPSVEEGGTGVVRIPIPRVSMESRQKTAALLGQRTEACRQKIRKVRRQAMDVVKQGVAGKLEGVAKDDAFRVQQQVENVMEQAMAKLSQVSQEKHDSIMAV